MKIKSNFKDYYDFIQGVYGVDEKIIYDRICKDRSRYNDEEPFLAKGLIKPEHILSSPKEYVFAICGKIYYLTYFEGEMHDGKGLSNGIVIDRTKRLTHWDTHTILHLSDTELNNEFNCPVMLLNPNYGHTTLSPYAMNPKLQDYGFGKFVEPREMYLTISNWLSKEKMIENVMTDNQKIVSHGMDVKTSFRKMPRTH